MTESCERIAEPLLQDPPELAPALQPWAGVQSALPGPGPGEIQLWLATTSISESISQRLQRQLSAAELERVRRFRRPADQRRQLLARGLVREALGGLAGIDPSELEFGTESRGKPHLISPANLGVNFNLSHSGEWVALVVAHGTPVGVDIEAPDPTHPMEAIAQRYFGPLERASVLRTTGSARISEFYRIWTVREAYLKATGSGLSGASSRDLLRSDGQLQDPQWQVWRLREPSGYQGALVARRGEWAVTGWRL